MKRGFAIIEIMLAMTIMLMVLTAVVSTSFGSQSFISSSQTSAEALNLAQGLLEQEQAEARKDFNLVNSVASTTSDVYEKAVYVTLKPDLLTKEVKALIAWKNERGATRLLDLTTLIANFDTPIGGNTCNSSPTGNWTNPIIENTTTNFAQLIGDAGGIYTLSDIDAYHGKLYVTASNTSAPTKPTFFVIDISDPAHPSLLGKVDNEGVGGTVSAGLSAARVAENLSSVPLKTYAYAMNAYAADYTTCTPRPDWPNYRPSCGQLDILDVTDSLNPTLSTNLMLASSSVPYVQGSQALGTSVYYRNGYLLMGLAATGPGNGPEFHIIDVHNQNLTALLSSASHILHPVGSYTVGHDVNAIAMRGTYAYITIPQDATAKEFQIFNIQTPSSIVPVGGYDVSGGGNGKSLYLVSNRAYFGNTNPSTGNDLHILDNTNPSVTLPEISGTNLTSSLNAIMVRSNLAFLLTNTALNVFDIGDPNSVNSFSMGGAVAGLVLPASGSATEPSMDCEGNRLYVTSNDATGHGFLYVIKPGT